MQALFVGRTGAYPLLGPLKVAGTFIENNLIVQVRVYSGLSMLFHQCLMSVFQYHSVPL